jgi:hypothetical protein
MVKFRATAMGGAIWEIRFLFLVEHQGPSMYLPPCEQAGLVSDRIGSQKMAVRTLMDGAYWYFY